MAKPAQEGLGTLSFNSIYWIHFFQDKLRDALEWMCFQFHLLDSHQITPYLQPLILCIVFQFHLLDSVLILLPNLHCYSILHLSIPFIGFPIIELSTITVLEYGIGSFQFHLLDSEAVGAGSQMHIQD